MELLGLGCYGGGLLGVVGICGMVGVGAAYDRDVPTAILGW